jgi:hypothetical protein
VSIDCLIIAASVFTFLIIAADVAVFGLGTFLRTTRMGGQGAHVVNADAREVDLIPCRDPPIVSRQPAGNRFDLCLARVAPDAIEIAAA